MATTSSSLTSATRGSTRASRWVVRLGAIGAGLVANLAYVLVVTKVIGYDLKVPPSFGQPAQSIQIGAVVAASIVPALLGWGLLELLERVVPRRAVLIWSIIAGVVLIGGLPFAAPGITVANKVLLAVMHLIVGAAVIPAFLASSPQRRR